ncbi:PAS domain S-box-containing protein [Haloplanus vescus]|uniref:histidine kinase n=2 Tax=Haloplanus vescus TaxID=555874 RepID=A0A1H3W540_9EURY|nr:PAS domain S-box-containing protein [Haloplanus vescus]
MRSETMSPDPDTIHVLHVDDDPDFVDLAAVFLERANSRFDVETATTVEDGLRRVEDDDIDCVVSDYDLPGRSGIEFLEAVRTTAPELPFILYTGKGSEEVASDAISAGVTDYLQKERGTDQYTVLANRITNAVEHHRSQQVVERSERRLREVIDALPHLLHVVDEDGTYHVANEALAEFHGTTVDTIEGSNVADILPEAQAAKFQHHLDRVLATGETIHIQQVRLEAANGDQHVFEPRLLPYNLADTGERAVLGIAVDVTERERRESELQRAYERVEFALERTDALIFDVDLDTGSVVRHGAYERFFNHDPTETPTWQDHCERAVHPEDREAFRQFHRELIDGERTSGEIEYRTDPEDGEVRWIRAYAHVKSDGEAESRHALGISRDITDQKERERELREKERRYRAVFNDPNILVGLLDTDGTFLDINEMAMGYVDTTVDAVRGTPLWETPWFEQSPAVEAELRDWVERAASGEYVEFETDLVKPSGDSYTLEGVIRPVRDDAGDVVSLLISDRDVTERRAYHRELEQARDLLVQTERIADVGGWEMDTETKEVFWTDHLFELLGVDPEAELVLDEALNYYHEDDRPIIERAIEDTLETGTSFDVSARFRRPDGEVRWLRVQGTPVVEDGDVVTLRGAVQDITQRVERERSLEQARAEYEELFDGMNDSAWVISTDAEFLAVNDAAVETTGYEREELLSMRPHDIDAGLDDDELSALIENMPADGSQVFETVQRTKDGDHIPVEISSSLITYHGETAILSIARDISNRKRRESRLAEFAYVASHDLRSPLNVAEGHLELAREAYDSPHLDSVASAHDRMETLIDDLLTLAQEGKDLDDLEEVDLASLVETCWESVPTEDAILDIDVTRSLRADRSRLRQLLENLVRNAVEHGGRDVTITVGQLDGGFYVEDDGTGIAAADTEAVFDTGYSSDEEGTGFGLSIVEQVVDAHEWEVRVTTSATGGARFEITGIEWVDE